MRLLFLFITLASLGYGGYWLSITHPDVKNKVEDLLHIGSFHTLEIRYTANQIMETHRKALLKDSRHKYLKPQLKFYPYVLMEVKYSVSPNKTKESMILWDLCDGEMVLETRGWEKTHGFGDCIKANADKQEFKVINTLARKGGSCDRETLAKSLQMESELLDSLINSLQKKQLIVHGGNFYRLHLQDPKIKVDPLTKIEEKLVTQPCKNSYKVKKRYSLTQIEKMAKAAFGNDFAIQHTMDIYLPVHSIVIQNPDGSLHTTLWNALNGKKLFYTY